MIVDLPEINGIRFNFSRDNVIYSYHGNLYIYVDRSKSSLVKSEHLVNFPSNNFSADKFNILNFGSDLYIFYREKKIIHSPENVRFKDDSIYIRESEIIHRYSNTLQHLYWNQDNDIFRIKQKMFRVGDEYFDFADLVKIYPCMPVADFRFCDFKKSGIVSFPAGRKTLRMETVVPETTTNFSRPFHFRYARNKNLIFTIFLIFKTMKNIPTNLIFKFLDF